MSERQTPAKQKPTVLVIDDESGILETLVSCHSQLLD